MKLSQVAKPWRVSREAFAGCEKENFLKGPFSQAAKKRVSRGADFRNLRKSGSFDTSIFPVIYLFFRVKVLFHLLSRIEYLNLRCD